MKKETPRGVLRANRRPKSGRPILHISTALTSGGGVETLVFRFFQLL
jgi:hypothetical protein